ncbi:hypothetical protein JAAARDRAFT_139797 [Jaapia argillacea MUCL 33604]|uniref:DUF300-domain-containing protein n=1 Tax=Jaapia argillacea MUCL 33604 TaxID=933084 RepID=A0A067P9Y5_9AGAM|nr:hypothetical protein JAAARDRAFT_139797 [Jaapia argillacea MUCL 33604]
MSCPSDNTAAVQQGSFWNGDNINWDTHVIGWAVSGGCAVLTVLISLVTILQHCRNYTNRGEQRQILRILYMPPVYAIISFFSYRYFRDYTYYALIEVSYEAVTLSAFLLLLIEYVAKTGTGHSAEKAMERKDKRPLPIPFCCWRYRPTKAYFMYTLKWSVLQYVIIRPLVSVVGIVCQAYNVLCEAGGFNFHFADAYLEIVDFISISVALYGLFLFYGLTKEELRGRRPLAKFLAIKLIVMFTWYQGFVFTALEGRVIHPTAYWTETNIANGLNALAICIEMVFFSAFMMWGYNWHDYVIPGEPKTNIFRPLWDSINYADFIHEIFGSFKYYFTTLFSSRPAHGPRIADTPNGKMDFGQAFGLHDSVRKYPSKSGGALNPYYASYDDDIRLAPYGPTGGADSPTASTNLRQHLSQSSEGAGYDARGYRRA